MNPVDIHTFEPTYLIRQYGTSVILLLTVLKRDVCGISILRTLEEFIPAKQP